MRKDTLFQCSKSSYAGPLSTDKLNVPAFHKFSLMPLIPSMIRCTNMEAVNRNMIKQGHDYATFESGSKIATLGTPKPFYSDQENRVPNLTTEANTFTTNTVFARYFGEQLRIDPTWKNEVIFSTQMRKLIDNGLSEHGKFISADAETKANHFVQLIAQLSRLYKDKLIQEAKLELQDGHYVVKDFGHLVHLIKNEFERRDMTDNVIDS